MSVVFTYLCLKCHISMSVVFTYLCLLCSNICLFCSHIYVFRVDFYCMLLLENSIQILVHLYIMVFVHTNSHVFLFYCQFLGHFRFTVLPVYYNIGILHVWTIDCRSMYLLLFTSNIIILQVGGLHENLWKQIDFAIISKRWAIEELSLDCPGCIVKLINTL